MTYPFITDIPEDSAGTAEPSVLELEHLEVEICDLLKETLLVDDLPLEADLLGNGLLDSLALIQLLIKLETRFSIRIPLDELQIEEIRSVASIAQLVRNRVSPAPANTASSGT
jgi:acyl carrier protein